MNELKLFNSSEFGEVRVVMSAENEPLFCLADVCKAVKLKNPSSVKTRLQESSMQLIDLHALNSNDYLVGNSMATFITESAFYDVLFMSSSKKVRPFRKWVTSEVLPSIRKHGAYATPVTIARMIADPDRVLSLTLHGARSIGRAL